jgi:hypothetical protein
MGAKSVLLRALVAASSAKTAGFGVPSFVPKWRARRDSNSRPSESKSARRFSNINAHSDFSRSVPALNKLSNFSRFRRRRAPTKGPWPRCDGQRRCASTHPKRSKLTPIRRAETRRLKAAQKPLRGRLNPVSVSAAALHPVFAELAGAVPSTRRTGWTSRAAPARTTLPPTCMRPAREAPGFMNTDVLPIGRGLVVVIDAPVVLPIPAPVVVVGVARRFVQLVLGDVGAVTPKIGIIG